LQFQFENSLQRDEVWLSIVEARLLTEAANLRRLELNGGLRLERLSHEVKPGDPTNVEATAARHYWKHLFDDFLRIKQGAGDPINTRLNYGYAILRALVAKEIAAAGLLPGVGVKHSNASNPFNLVDDLMEPFRFVVELHVALLESEVEFKGQAKLDVLKFIERSVAIGGTNYRLIPSVHELVLSYVRILEGKGVRLSLPTGWGTDEPY